MKKLKSRALKLLLLLSFIPVVAQPVWAEPKAPALSSAEQTALILKIEENLKSIKILRADFDQTRHLSLFLDTLKAKGRFSFEAPDKLRWEIFSPYTSILILNEQSVAKFNRKGNNLKKMTLGMEDVLRAVLKQIVSIMRGEFSQVQEVYSISVKKEKNLEMVFIPKNKKMAEMISSLNLKLDEKLNHIRTIIIHEPMGDYIEIRFYNEQENVPLEKDLFNVDTPSLPAVKE